VLRVAVQRGLRASVVVGTIVSTFVACFGKPDDPGENSQADAAPDGHGGGTDGSGSGSGCTLPHDDFNHTGSACAAWGSAFGSNTPTLNGSDVSVVPLIGADVGCHTLQPFDFSQGASIAVVGIAESPMYFNTTYFRVMSASTQGMQVSITYMMTITNLYISCISGTTMGTNMDAYNSTAMRYWKFEPLSATSVGAFYSPDGMTWKNSNVSCSWPSTATTSVYFGAMGGSDANTQAATFDDFNTKTCTH
jgi:hypothetical protein